MSVAAPSNIFNLSSIVDKLNNISSDHVFTSVDFIIYDESNPPSAPIVCKALNVLSTLGLQLAPTLFNYHVAAGSLSLLAGFVSEWVQSQYCLFEYLHFLQPTLQHVKVVVGALAPVTVRAINLPKLAVLKYQVYSIRDEMNELSKQIKGIDAGFKVDNIKKNALFNKQLSITKDALIVQQNTLTKTLAEKNTKIQQTKTIPKWLNVAGTIADLIITVYFSLQSLENRRNANLKAMASSLESYLQKRMVSIVHNYNYLDMSEYLDVVEKSYFQLQIDEKSNNYKDIKTNLDQLSNLITSYLPRKKNEMLDWNSLEHNLKKLCVPFSKSDMSTTLIEDLNYFKAWALLRIIKSHDNWNESIVNQNLLSEIHSLSLEFQSEDSSFNQLAQNCNDSRLLTRNNKFIQEALDWLQRYSVLAREFFNIQKKS